MSEDMIAAPFGVGEHVCYIAAQGRSLPASPGNEKELVLAPGMVGVIVLSTNAFSGDGAAAPRPWHCQVQFQNGFQPDITPQNCAEFEMTNGSGSPTV